jgi:hypothetical protein
VKRTSVALFTFRVLRNPFFVPENTRFFVGSLEVQTV